MTNTEHTRPLSTMTQSPAVTSNQHQVPQCCATPSDLFFVGLLTFLRCAPPERPPTDGSGGPVGVSTDGAPSSWFALVPATPLSEPGPRFIKARGRTHRTWNSPEDSASRRDCTSEGGVWHSCHVMSCHGALEPSSAGPPSGCPSAERRAVTHTRTPMEWAPGEGGAESTMHGAKERGARTKLGPPRAGERTLRNTSPADRPRLSGNWWVSP